MKKIRPYLYLVMLLIASSFTNFLTAQCNPDDDITPPTLSCTNLSIDLAPGQDLTITPSFLIDGDIWDDCTPPDLLVLNMFDDSNPGVPIDSYNFPAGTNGTFIFSLTLIDLAGNTTTCNSLVIITSATPICTPDVSAPNAICESWIQLTTSSSDITLTTTDVNDGSWDNCTNQADLLLYLSDDVNGSLPSTTSVTYPAGFTGLDTLILWVVDAAGNTSSCLTFVNINDCTPNVPLPNLLCNPNLVIPYSPGDYVLDPFDILEGTFDSCTMALFDFTIAISTNSIPAGGTPTITIPADAAGVFSIFVFVTNSAGVVNSCWTQIIIEPNPVICNNDNVPPVAVCDFGYFVSAIAGEPINIPANVLDDGSNDNCTINLEFYATLDGSLTSPPTTDTLTFPPNTNGTFNVYLWVVDEAGNASVCQSSIVVETFHVLAGRVFADGDGNCMLDTDELRLQNITVRYTLDQGATYESTTTDANGNYGFSVFGLNPGEEVVLEVVLPNGLSSNCPTSHTLTSPINPNPYFVDFPIQLASDCDQMTVDVSAPFLRRCFPTNYTVNYCNNSAYDIDDAEVLVTLPPEMVISNVSAPYTQPMSSQLLFEVGTVASGTCSNITITVILDCNTPLGATKCVQAEVTPNDCQQPDATWSGASLEVTANCNEDTDKVEFTITNTGIGTMIDAREYIVIEDVIMYMQNPIQLGPGGFETIEFPANGSTWRLQIDQEPGHPSVSNPTVVVEGCTEYGSMGFVNQFSMGDADPYIAIDCQEVIGSYDPNDKQAFPVGYAEEHFIEPNVSIEYKIRFQNTGTDTAFTVRVEDQLSPTLDLSSIQAGASSHPYRLEVREGGWLVFHFEDILLPDSTTNEPASHGFIQFRVNQIADNPLGTIIENTADIYFDFNEAIRTNTTFHEVGLNFIVSSTTNSFVPDLEVSVAPNPLNTEAIFSLKGEKINASQFELYDMFGRLITQDNVTNNQYKLQRNNLPAGTYIFRFLDEEQLLANGKVVIL